MKYFGIFSLLAGLGLGIFALNMKVNVDVEARDFGYGIRTPAMSVANVNLMEQRQNLLIFSGVLAVVGAILTGFASMRPAAPAPAPAPVALKDGEGLLDFLNEKSAGPAVAERPVASVCPKCHSVGGGDDVKCERCGAEL